MGSIYLHWFIFHDEFHTPPSNHNSRSKERMKTWAFQHEGSGSQGVGGSNTAHCTHWMRCYTLPWALTALAGALCSAAFRNACCSSPHGIRHVWTHRSRVRGELTPSLQVKKGSEGKGARHQAWQLELYPWVPNGRRWQMTPVSCPVIFTNMGNVHT